MPACRTQLFSILIAAALSIPAAWSQESRATVLGRVIRSEEVRNLPLHLGDVDNMIRLGNGVAFTDEPAKDQPWQPLNTAYAMAGSPSSRNEFTLDGSSNTFHDEARSAVGQAWTCLLYTSDAA